ncbi:MAG: hypothetical protein KDE19_20515 [Caldilineaceae bacterium]|nr:hypothetical protein [Caldilineaceae bacterium]
MAADERRELIQQSKATLDQYVRQHPQFSIDSWQPEYRGGTNFVTFGHLGEQPVVFKYFVRTYRWAHECFCLRHFAETGYVPKILDVVPERLIVMTRLPANNDDNAQLHLAERQQISYQLGQAVATFVQWPLPTAENRPVCDSEFEQFAWRSDVGDLVRQCVTLCRQIQQALPVYQIDLFTESINLVEQQIDYIDQQPRLLFHEDIPNMCVYRGQFQGFYDLEMVRIGTEALQLGVVVDLIKPHWQDEQWLVWPDFLQGYQATTGRSLDERAFAAILAMNHFYYHIRICRWGKWNGDPAQTASLHFAKTMAPGYLKAIKTACYNLRQWVDLKQWFPSLQ